MNDNRAIQLLLCPWRRTAVPKRQVVPQRVQSLGTVARLVEESNMEQVTRHKCQIKGCPFVSTIESPVCEDHMQQIGRIYLETRSVAGSFLRLREALNRDIAASVTRAQENAVGPDGGFIETVYYVRMSDHVKIGTTNDLTRRLRSLYLDHDPKLLLAVEPGGWSVEQHRHAQFNDERVWSNRELFNPSPRLLAHIADLNAKYAPPISA